MNITVIYNPTAGGGRARRLRQLMRALEEGGASVRLYYTRAPGDATRYLRALEEQGECVVAAGGDGTTNDVINGLKPGVALALFPIGTANVLAREVNMPKRPAAAAKVILEGRTLAVTPARLNGRRFMVMCGIGYDAWVVDQVDLILKRRLGKLAYLLSMIRQLFRYGEVRYRITVDGRPLDCFSAIITHGRYYGGGFLLSRKASLSRPSLQVLMFQRPGLLFLLRCLVALVLGRMERVPGVASLNAERVTVSAPTLEPIQADGDPVGFLPAVIEMESQAVPMRVPWA